MVPNRDVIDRVHVFAAGQVETHLYFVRSEFVVVSKHQIVAEIECSWNRIAIDHQGNLREERAT